MGCVAMVGEAGDIIADDMGKFMRLARVARRLTIAHGAPSSSDIGAMPM